MTKNDHDTKNPDNVVRLRAAAGTVKGNGRVIKANKQKEGPPNGSDTPDQRS